MARPTKAETIARQALQKTKSIPQLRLVVHELLIRLLVDHGYEGTYYRCNSCGVVSEETLDILFDLYGDPRCGKCGSEDIEPEEEDNEDEPGD